MYATPLRLSEAEDWPTPERVRRIGWIDQKGRVYIALPPASTFDGGSLSALLVALDD